MTTAPALSQTPAETKIVDRLVAAGMSEPAAAAKGRLFAGAMALLGGEPSVAFFVPGRIEVLGKHTDYAGGRSLLCAVERGFCVVARARADSAIRLTTAATGETATFALDPALSPIAGHWSNYPMTVAARVAENYPGAGRGADIVFDSDLPPAAGMSSSSALVVATFLTLSAINDLPSHPAYQAAIHNLENLSEYLGTIENGQSFGPLRGRRGVGTFGGSEDHTAILCSSAGNLVQYAFKPVRREAVVPMPAGHVFVIAVSGVVAEKTRAAREKYNRVSQTASVILDAWQRSGGKGDSLAAALASRPGAAEKMRGILSVTEDAAFTPAELLARVDQFIDESDRIIPRTAAALSAGRLGELAALVHASQTGAEAALGNQVPETVFLAATARERGAVAATAFGAGFGGSVWALVTEDAAPGFAAAWLDAYRDAFPQSAARAQTFITQPGPSAVPVWSEPQTQR